MSASARVKWGGGSGVVVVGSEYDYEYEYGYEHASSAFSRTEVGVKRKRSVQDEALRLMLGHIHVRKAGFSSTSSITTTLSASPSSTPSPVSPSASSSSSSSCWLTCQPQQWRGDELDLDVAPSPGFGWEKCLDLQTGKFYFVNRSTGTKKQYPHIKTSNPDSAKAAAIQENNVVEPPHHQPSEDILNLDLNLALGGGGGSSTPNEVRTKVLIDLLPVLQFSTSTTSDSPPHSGISFEDEITEDLHRQHPSQPAMIYSKKDDAAALSLPPALVTVGCSKCLMFVMLPQDDPRCPRCGNCALLGLPNHLDSL